LDSHIHAEKAACARAFLGLIAASGCGYVHISQIDAAEYHTGDFLGWELYLHNLFAIGIVPVQ
tara:strand:+ start:332 stop:520 length:189 start_codon:yes stop_codon:yes gene_type:complete